MGRFYWVLVINFFGMASALATPSTFLQCEKDRVHYRAGASITLEGVEFQLEGGTHDDDLPVTIQHGINLELVDRQVWMRQSQTAGRILIGSIPSDLPADFCRTGGSPRVPLTINPSLKITNLNRTSPCFPTIGFILWAPGIDWARKLDAHLVLENDDQRIELRDPHLYNRYRTLRECASNGR